MKRDLSPGYSAVWWHSKIRCDGNTLTPVEPFKSYDPFKWYFPFDRLKQGSLSLPYLFISVNSGNMSEIVDFCERFGVLGPKERQGESFDPIFIDSIHSIEPARGLNSGIGIDDDLRERLGGEIKHYRSGLGSMTAEDFRLTQNSLREAVEWAKLVRADRLSASGQEAAELLRIRLNGKLQMVRPRLGWEVQEARWFTCWDIGSLEAAMFLMLFFDIQGPAKLLTCTECNRLFLGGREWTSFCSPSCKNRYHQREWRKMRSIQHSGKGRGKTKRTRTKRRTGQ